MRTKKRVSNLGEPPLTSQTKNLKKSRLGFEYVDELPHNLMLNNKFGKIFIKIKLIWNKTNSNEENMELKWKVRKLKGLRLKIN